MEIERKYLIKEMPENISEYEHHEISQGYVDTDPVVRIRRYDDNFILTIKSRGLLERIEIEKDLSQEEFEQLSQMVQGNLIEKTRYIIPYNGLKLEIDEFHGIFEGLKYGEVEFDDIESSKNFTPPDYMFMDVTEEPRFQNSSLSKMNEEEIQQMLSSILHY